jgi:hypothetical protein
VVSKWLPRKPEMGFNAKIRRVGRKRRAKTNFLRPTMGLSGGASQKHVRKASNVHYTVLHVKSPPEWSLLVGERLHGRNGRLWFAHCSVNNFRIDVVSQCWTEKALLAQGMDIAASIADARGRQRFSHGTSLRCVAMALTLGSLNRQTD